MEERVEPVDGLYPVWQAGYRKIETAKQKEGHNDQSDVIVEMVNVFDGSGIADSQNGEQ